MSSTVVECRCPRPQTIASDASCAILGNTNIETGGEKAMRFPVVPCAATLLLASIVVAHADDTYTSQKQLRELLTLQTTGYGNRCIPGRKNLTRRSSRSPTAHSDVQHSAPARAWLRHYCPSRRSMLNAAYLGVRAWNKEVEFEKDFADSGNWLWCMELLPERVRVSLINRTQATAAVRQFKTNGPSDNCSNGAKIPM